MDFWVKPGNDEIKRRHASITKDVDRRVKPAMTVWILRRHARPWAGHPRLAWPRLRKTVMAGSSPAMTK
jgi:hypothetical protein